jgi:chromosome segregation ATPase
MMSACIKVLPCCTARRQRELAAAAETELLLASIDSLGTRLQGLRTNLRTAEEQSRSADQAELRHIRREHEAENRCAMEAVREVGAVEQRLLEAQTAMQQTKASLGRAQRRRNQLRDELQVGEDSVRSAESGITQAKGVAEQVLVAMKQKVQKCTKHRLLRSPLKSRAWRQRPVDKLTLRRSRQPFASSLPRPTSMGTSQTSRKSCT